MKIAFCFNVKHPGTEGLQTELDFDAPETIDAIFNTIRGLGHEVIKIEADENAFDNLKKLKGQIDLVFTIAEGLRGDARESQIPIYCELLGIPYTHSTPTVHALCLDKHLTKIAVAGAGVRVPKSVLILKGETADLEELKSLNFPVIVKPNGEGSSVGVFDGNVVESPEKAAAKIKWLREQGLSGELLAEEYIDGREFTVGLLGNGETLQVLPIIEQRFEFLPKELKPMAGYELKWKYEDALADNKVAYDCPAKLTGAQNREITETSRKVFNELKIRDCARIDYRMNREGELFFLEVNTLPGINPIPEVLCYFLLGTKAAGLEFPQVVERIIGEAVKRWGIEYE
jgi:D-alanine-D-alanine ligase